MRSTTQFIKKTEQAGLSLNIKNPKALPLPPEISANAFNENKGFDPETVVSRMADGSIDSRFKDPSWSFKSLVPANANTDTMRFPKDEALASEVKTILKLVMITPTAHQVEFSRFWAYMNLLNRLAEFCSEEKTTLKELFNSNGGIHLFKLIKDNMAFYAQGMITISDYLHFMREEMGFVHGYKPLSQNTQAKLRKVIKDYKDNSKQNPVIPSRILKAIYADTIDEYETLLPVLDQLLQMQLAIDAHPMNGLNLKHQKDSCPEFCGTSFGKLKVSYPNNYDLAEKYPLARDYLNQHFKSGNAKPQDNGFDFDVLYDRAAVINAINYIQRVCQDMIIMFTGMRPAEAGLLPYFGSKETVVDGVKYWLIYGFAVKKRTGIPPFEMWVTNEHGYNAFQTAKRIADQYYTRNQRQPILDIPDDGLTPDLSPLFLRDDNQINKRGTTQIKTPALSKDYTISKADFDELKMIDPHRIWEGEPKFDIGKPFPVALGYFRRSVAFFASASGVSLVDRKNQLHHLFDAETFYYSQGSGRANPFLKDKESFASYFNQVKHEAEAFSFINEVINYDGKLFGASAVYAERNQGFYATIRTEERTETNKRFKRGELSYTETHVGGCKTISPCKNKALGSVTACLGCKDADIIPSKLAHAINEQAELIAGLDTKRLEYRTEIYELIEMLDFAIKNISNAMEELDRRKSEYKQFSQWLKEFKRMKTSYLKKIDKHGEAV